MTKADVGAIAARFFAIAIAVNTIPALPAIAPLFGHPQLSVTGLMVQAGALGLYVMLALVLWTGADRIGRWFAGSNAGEALSIGITADDLLLTTCIATGGLFLLLSAASLIGQSWPAMSPNASPVAELFAPHRSAIAVEVALIVFATALIIGARRLVSVTNRQSREPRRTD